MKPIGCLIAGAVHGAAIPVTGLSQA